MAWLAPFSCLYFFDIFSHIEWSFHLVFRQCRDSNPRQRTMAWILSPRRDQGASPNPLWFNFAVSLTFDLSYIFLWKTEIGFRITKMSFPSIWSVKAVVQIWLGNQSRPCGSGTSSKDEIKHTHLTSIQTYVDWCWLCVVGSNPTVLAAQTYSFFEWSNFYFFI